MTATPKYSSTFIFETKDLTGDFHRINSEIALRARQIPGFLGEEAWRNEDTGLHAEVYYWADMDALRKLVDMNTHRLAKSRYGEWLGEYRVVISEVQTVYGNPTLGLEHTPGLEEQA
ncbi:hypothetical protein ASC66_04280 [Leifsonia sp. Root4]|uniref:antibiotic biosynthesis monooxygenase family protein n=1 Tax=Leifsonia sp. Root4 TaxID=1736525 RepID=UPI000701A35E|nr:hypothetical protein [Leifsonia sp. Root4]KQW08158.1 hypothetical protein ASC66_04280 [Leifsonia sp. Root4]